MGSPLHVALGLAQMAFATCRGTGLDTHSLWCRVQPQTEAGAPGGPQGVWAEAGMSPPATTAEGASVRAGVPPLSPQCPPLFDSPPPPSQEGLGGRGAGQGVREVLRGNLHTAPWLRGSASASSFVFSTASTCRPGVSGSLPWAAARPAHPAS